MDRRRKPWKRITSNEAFNFTDASGAPELGSGDVEVLDELVFDYRTESRCKVCSASDPNNELPDGEAVRDRVDRMLLRGRTYRDILEAVSNQMHEWPPERRVSYYSIRNHQRRHLPADQAAVREIVERRARENGLQVAVGKGPLLTNAAAFELIREKGFEAVASGAVTPSIRDTLEAARLLAELEKEAAERFSVSELTRQVEAFVDVVRERLPKDEWQKVLADVESRLSAGPALTAGPEQDSAHESAEETDHE